MTKLIATLIHGLKTHPLFEGFNLIGQTKGSCPTIIIPEFNGVCVILKISTAEFRCAEIMNCCSIKDLEINGKKHEEMKWIKLENLRFTIGSENFEVKWLEDDETDSDSDIIPCSQNVMKSAPVPGRSRSLSYIASGTQVSLVQTSKSCQILAASTQAVSQIPDTEVNDVPETIEESDDEIFPETQQTIQNSDDEYIHIDPETEEPDLDFSASQSQIIPLVDESYHRSFSNHFNSTSSFGVDQSTNASIHLRLEESEVSNEEKVLVAEKNDISNNQDVQNDEIYNLRETSVTPDIEGLLPVDEMRPDTDQREGSITPDLDEYENLNKTLTNEDASSEEETNGPKNVNKSDEDASKNSSANFLEPKMPTLKDSKTQPNRVDDNITELNNSENDLLVMQTQKFHAPDSKRMQKPYDDIFDAETQRFDSKNLDVLSKEDDSIFDAPTQAFKLPTSSNKSQMLLQNLNDSIFDAPTQAFVATDMTASNFKNPQNSADTSKNSSDNIYDVATQAFIPDYCRLNRSPIPVENPLSSQNILSSDEDSSFLTAQTAIVPSQLDFMGNVTISQLATPVNIKLGKLPDKKQCEAEAKEHNEQLKCEAEKDYLIESSINPIAHSTMIRNETLENFMSKPGSSKRDMLTSNIFTDMNAVDTISDLDTPEFLSSKCLDHVEQNLKDTEDTHYFFEDRRSPNKSDSENGPDTKNSEKKWQNSGTSNETVKKVSILPRPKPPSEQKQYTKSVLPQPKPISEVKSFTSSKQIETDKSEIVKASTSGSNKITSNTDSKKDSSDSNASNKTTSRKRIASDSGTLVPPVREKSSRKRFKSTILSDEFVTDSVNSTKSEKPKEKTRKRVNDEIQDKENSASESNDEDRLLKPQKRAKPVEGNSPNVSVPLNKAIKKSERSKATKNKIVEEQSLKKLVPQTTDDVPGTSAVSVSKTRSKTKINEEKVVKPDTKKNSKAVNTNVTNKHNAVELKEVSSLVRQPSRVKEQHKILFTRVDSEAYEKKISKAGHTVVTSPHEATVLVTDKTYRTYKFLSALARGIPIVTALWFKAWTGKIVPDPYDYLLIDKEAEKRYNYSITNCLTAAQRNPLLKDYTIICSPSTKPPPAEMKVIVECAQGQFSVIPIKASNKTRDNILVVADQSDHQFIKSMKKLIPGVNIINGEAFMLSIMRQKIILDSEYRL